MGAVFNVCLVQATAAEFSNFCQIWQGSVIGTALPASIDYRQADWSSPLLLLMGNEQAGLSAVSYTHLRAHETPEHLVKTNTCSNRKV